MVVSTEKMELFKFKSDMYLNKLYNHKLAETMIAVINSTELFITSYELIDQALIKRRSEFWFVDMSRILTAGQNFINRVTSVSKMIIKLAILDKSSAK